MNLLPNTQLIRVSGAAAGATTEIDSTAVDMAGAESVTFVASLATLADTAVVTLTAQGRDTTSASWGDLVASVAHAASGAETARLIALEVFRPMRRYVRLKVTRTTANTAVDCILALVTMEGRQPVLQPAGVDTNTVLSP